MGLEATGGVARDGAGRDGVRAGRSRPEVRAEAQEVTAVLVEFWSR